MCPIKITIATVTYNAEETLQRTLDSVAEQTYAGIEHLIIDGCSKDRTMELIHRYVDDNTGREVTHDIVVVREPDKGLYDAMNKALENATGDYIVSLMQATGCTAPTHCHKRSGTWKQPPDTGLPSYTGDRPCGRGRTVHPPSPPSAPARLNWKSFRWGMLVCHQSFYVRTDLARQTPYNLDYRFSADYDWCIRLMKLAERLRLPIVNSKAILTDYLHEGLTTQNRKASLWERFHIMAHHYGLPATLVQHGLITIRAVFKK